MLNIQAKTLRGKWVQLEPLDPVHRQELYSIAQNPRIWTFSGVKAFGEDFDPWFEKALAAQAEGKQFPFVVRDLPRRAIAGSTRFYDIFPEDHRLAIGYTWYVPESWGNYTNPESKFLLLSFAFEDCAVNRVEFITDARNLHSRAAIKKLGAIEEGLLRQHMILKDGYVRDSVIFSITQSDWPLVRLNLQKRLETFQ